MEQVLPLVFLLAFGVRADSLAAKQSPTTSRVPAHLPHLAFRLYSDIYCIETGY